jgi:hypothetical protein
MQQPKFARPFPRGAAHAVRAGPLAAAREGA